MRFYKMINEMPFTERPDDEIVEDDVKVDRWYDDYLRKLAHEAGQHTTSAADFAKVPQFRV